MFTIKKFYYKYFSQIALAFEIKTIKKIIFNVNQKRITQAQMQKYFANTLFLILLIVNQQIITLFLRKIQTIKLITTLIIISSAARKDSKICNIFLNNSFKYRRIINNLKNKFIFIIQS